MNTKFIKKISLTIVLIMVLFLNTSCSQIESVINSVSESFSNTIDPSELYPKLSSIISSPSHMDTFHQDYIGKSITFSVYVAAEPETYTFDDDDELNGHHFVPAYISRNTDSYFYLDVESVKDDIVDDEYYQVTASLEGTLYSVENGLREDIAYFTVTAAEILTPLDFSEEIPTFALSNGSITFFDYELRQDSFERDVIILYFDYENTTDSDSSPSLRELVIYQNDFLSDSSMPFSASSSAELKHTNALSIGSLSNNKVPAGKTLSYYCVYYLTDFDTPIQFYSSDDDFNLLNFYSIIPSEEPSF